MQKAQAGRGVQKESTKFWKTEDSKDWGKLAMYSDAMQLQSDDVGCDCEVIGNEGKPRVRPVIKAFHSVHAIDAPPGRRRFAWVRIERR
jgi:hypothetical protein